MIPFSILDLAPICEGADTAQSFDTTVRLAQLAEEEGFTRYWLAEHHNMPGIASAATSVLLAHVAAHTKTIRVGSGGVMLPNHAPLMVAEQFGTLATLHPGRVDLGLGRAPGTDQLTMRALRRGKEHDRFPDDVMELMGYLGPPKADVRVRAVPGEGTEVPLWILGSSLYGAQLAAHLGLPYAFASHFAPDALAQAAEIYKSGFQAGPQADRPYFMLAANVYCAETEVEAKRLQSSHQLAFANLRMGRPGKLPAPVDDIEATLPLDALAMINHSLAVSACGTPDQVRDQLGRIIARFEPDELILNGSIHDPEARLRSFKLVAEVMRSLTAERAAE